ncbi:MAG: hypothetical protein GX911_00210 [Spirochaetales bacterium]|nr:hypothetical protein [Spirochaetales bacterium]
MKTNESWDLRSVGDISAQKIRRNLRELAVFSANSIRSLKDVASRYEPVALLEHTLEHYHRTVIREWKGDGEAIRIAQVLVSYLAHLLQSLPKPLSRNGRIRQKDWKEVVRLFDDIVRKSIRTVDNTALALRAEGTLTDPILLERFQKEASGWVLPPVFDDELLKRHHRSLLYQLQPFNALISEVFPSHLDGVLQALATLIETGEHELLGHTSLGEADVKVLARPAASEEFRVDNHRLTHFQRSSLKPFILIDGSYHCFDPRRVLIEGYAVIKEAVTSSSAERKEAWERIEKDKRSLLPITFFTTMLSSMHYTRNVEHEGGLLDALFEDGKKELVVQVPAAHTLFPEDPLQESEAYARALIEERRAIDLAKTHPASAVIVDLRAITEYPLSMIDDTLTLSFLQVATLATTREGANEIKGVLGLMPPSREEESIPEHDPLKEFDEHLEDELEWEEEEEEPSFDDDELLEEELAAIDEEDEYEDEPEEFEGDEVDEYAVFYEDDEYESEPLQPIGERKEPEFTLEAEVDTSWQRSDQGFTLRIGSPPIIEGEYLDYPEKEGDDRAQVGSSFFTSENPLDDHLGQDEYETADELFSQSEQPLLFDVEDERMFDPFYRTARERQAVEEDYESEALGLFESGIGTGGDDDEEIVVESSFVLADEEMEEGKEDLLRYNTRDFEDEDGGEFGFLDQIQRSVEQRKRPSSRFTLVNAVEHAKHLPPSRKEEEESDSPDAAPKEEKTGIRPFELDLPPNLSAIFALLAKKDRWSFNSYLKESTPDVIDSLERMLGQIRDTSLEPGKDRMFTSVPLELTIIVLAAKGDPLSAWTRKVNVAALMHANGKRSWRALSIGYDKKKTPVFADDLLISREDFTPTDWKFVINAANRLQDRKRV